jgi:uncharacterized membrane protein YhaH (DUF805 family)
MKQLVLGGRLVFGAWMLVNGANHLFLSLWPLPTGHEPLAIQLMAAFIHSGLINVAMAIQLIAGALILTGFFVPVALCVVMPVSTCALYWSAVLDHQPLGAVLAFVAFALNGLLMLAYLDYYRGALQRSAATLGEASANRATFQSAFVTINGRTSRGPFIAALITLLAVVVFYAFLVTGRTAQFCMLVLLFPAIVLHARRLHDMGHNAWLLIAPVVLMVAAFAIWLRYVSLGVRFDVVVPLVALATAAGFALWGCVGSSRSEPNQV